MRPNYQTYLETIAPGLNFPERKRYDLNLIQIRNALSGTQFVKGLFGFLESLAQEYAPGHPELLFGEVRDPKLFTKTYDSAINKTYRANVLFNRNYPEPPKDGRIDGANFYRRINDIIRTRLVCRYLDGPQFVAERLQKYCEQLNIPCRVHAMNNDRGYYAWHFYCRNQMDVFGGAGVISEEIEFELQITTQLVDVLDALTHTLYEADRVTPGGRPDDSWKWQPETQRFKSAYLGHTLHLLEGVILGLKNEVMAPNEHALEAPQMEQDEEKKA